MAEFPALPLFTDAYMADTRHLSAAQHGAYLLLLMTAWRMPDCCLPDDDRALARWAAMDHRTWLKNKAAVMTFWKLGEDAKWRQHRLLDERNHVENRRHKNSDAGKASALKRKNRGSTSVQPNGNQNSTPIPTPIPSSNSLDSEPNGSSSKPAAARARAKAPKVKVQTVAFSFDERKFQGITQLDVEGWADAYPALDIVHELKRMRQWLLANPSQRKTNYPRFINTWLKKEQDKGGRYEKRAEPNGRTGGPAGGIGTPLAGAATGRDRRDPAARAADTAASIIAKRRAKADPLG
jgi:uncharacterized protein YdaU (DUF1376 family)